MRCKTWIGGLAFALGAVAMAWGLAPTDLRRRPKVGDEVAGRLTVSFQMFGMASSYTARQVDKVIQASEGSYQVERRWKGYTMNLGDEEAPVADEDLPVEVRTLAADGSLTALAGSNPSAASVRMVNLELFRPPSDPVDVGGKWTVEVAANASLGTRQAKADYEVEAAERLGEWDTFVVKFTYTEQGEGAASSTGRLWVRLSDGAVVKMKAEFKAAPLPGLNSPTNLTVTFEP